MRTALLILLYVLVIFVIGLHAAENPEPYYSGVSNVTARLAYYWYTQYSTTQNIFEVATVYVTGEGTNTYVAYETTWTNAPSKIQMEAVNETNAVAFYLATHGSTAEEDGSILLGTNVLETIGGTLYFNGLEVQLGTP